METKRKNGLDILRIIATVLIVFHHYQQALGDFPGSSFSFYSGKFYFGYIVELFFVLSGFLSFRYVERIQNGLNFGTFIGKRALRLLPGVCIGSVLFYILSILYLHLNQEPWLGSYSHFWEIGVNAIGMQAGWFFDANRLNFPLWYISVLLICYIWLYLFTWLSSKIKVPKEIWYFIMGIVGLGIKLCLARGIIIHVPFFNGYTARGYFAFFFGLLLACFWRKWKRADYYLVFGILLLIVLPLFFVNILIMEYVLMVYVFCGLVALFSIPFLFKWVKWPGIEKLGNATYWVYVLHMPCLIVLALLGNNVIKQLNLTCYPVMIGFTVVLFLLVFAVQSAIMNTD